MRTIRERSPIRRWVVAALFVSIRTWGRGTRLKGENRSPACAPVNRNPVSACAIYLFFNDYSGLSSTATNSTFQPSLIEICVQHPDKIIHMGTEYSLTHLKEFVDFFDWKLSDGRHVTFRMAVRFADHCYTDERLPLVDGCYTVPGKRKPRVFCTDRHVRSFQVPAIVRGLFSKPAQTISMTMENNWATFCLQMKPAIPAESGTMCSFESSSWEGIPASIRSQWTFTSKVPMSKTCKCGSDGWHRLAGS